MQHKTIFQLFDKALIYKNTYYRDFVRASKIHQIMKPSTLSMLLGQNIPENKNFLNSPYKERSFYPDIDVNNSCIPDEELLTAQLLPSQFLKKIIEIYPQKSSELYIQYEKYKLIKKFQNNLLYYIIGISDKDLINKIIKDFFQMNDVYLLEIIRMENFPKYERILFNLLLKTDYNNIIDIFHLFYIALKENQRCYFIPKIYKKSPEYRLGDICLSKSSISGETQYVIRTFDKYGDIFFNLQKVIEIYHINNFEDNFIEHNLDLKFYFIYNELSDLRGTRINQYFELKLGQRKLVDELKGVEEVEDRLRLRQINLYERQPSKTETIDFNDFKDKLLCNYDKLLDLYNISYLDYSAEFNNILYSTLQNYFNNLPAGKIKNQIKYIEKRKEKYPDFNVTELIIKNRPKILFNKDWYIWELELK